MKAVMMSLFMVLACTCGVHDVAFMKGGRNRAARDNQYLISEKSET